MHYVHVAEAAVSPRGENVEPGSREVMSIAGSEVWMGAGSGSGGGLTQLLTQSWNHTITLLDFPQLETRSAQTVLPHTFGLILSNRCWKCLKSWRWGDGVKFVGYREKTSTLVPLFFCVWCLLFPVFLSFRCLFYAHRAADFHLSSSIRDCHLQVSVTGEKRRMNESIWLTETDR